MGYAAAEPPLGADGGPLCRAGEQTRALRGDLRRRCSATASITSTRSPRTAHDEEITTVMVLVLKWVRYGLLTTKSTAKQQPQKHTRHFTRAGKHSPRVVCVKDL